MQSLSNTVTADPGTLPQTNIEDNLAFTDTQTVLWSNPNFPPESIESRDLLIINRDNLVTSDPSQVPRRSRGPLTEEERMKLEEQGIYRDHHHSDESIVMARYQLDKLCDIAGAIEGNTEEVKRQITNTMKNTNKHGGKLLSVLE